MSADWVARHHNTDLQNSVNNIRTKLSEMEYDQSLTMISLSILKDDPVFQKALAIRSSQLKEKICLEAGICPTCGNLLEEIEEKSKEFFGNDRFLTVCSSDKSHYAQERYYNNEDY